MKKLIYFIPLFLFSSCGLNTGTNKFVVESINQIEGRPGIVSYQIQTYNVFEFDLIDSVGKFQVGDTLKLKK